MLLDDIDKQILNLLFKNGRESLTTISENVIKADKKPMSHMGIKKRISKIEKAQVLKVQGNINLGSLNYRGCFILLEMKNYDEVKKIIEAYTDCPRVFLLSHVQGQFNLIMGIVGQSVDVLHRYINYCGPTNKEGILHSQTLFISELIAPKFLPINLFSKESQESKCGNICRDCEAFLDGKCNGCGSF